jgi:hypothetical protein
MKASELISRLQGIVATEGDLDVLKEHWDGEEWTGTYVEDEITEVELRRDNTHYGFINCRIVI